MIDESGIPSALELGRQGPESWRSESTTFVTPESTPPASAPHDPPSSASSSVSDSGKTSPCRTRSLNRRGSVRWSDECGGELVTEVGTITDYWEMMVFGEDKCCSNQSNSSSDNDSPGELFRFIGELSRGVEATLVSPSLGGINKKRRPVILYTEDNGESICWIKKSGNASGQPYRIRCKTLLEVKDKSGASLIEEREADCICRAEAGDGEGWERQNAGSADVRIGLKWLPQPTWPKRSAKLVDVQTEDPAAFTRGMQQLLSFNTDLQC